MKEEEKSKKTKEIIEERSSIDDVKIKRFVSLALKNFEEETK